MANPLMTLFGVLGAAPIIRLEGAESVAFAARDLSEKIEAGGYAGSDDALFRFAAELEQAAPAIWVAGQDALAWARKQLDSASPEGGEWYTRPDPRE